MKETTDMDNTPFATVSSTTARDAITQGHQHGLQPNQHVAITDVRLIAADDPGYLAFCARRVAERRARAASIIALPPRSPPQFGPASRLVFPNTRVGRRTSALHEYRPWTQRTGRAQIGRLVEKAARHWLGFHAKLEQKRILASAPCASG